MSEIRTSVLQTPTTSADDLTQIAALSGNHVTLELIYTEIKTLKSQQELYQKTINELKIIINDYKNIVNNVTEENVELKNEIETLHSKLDNVEYLMDNRDQQNLNNNLIINGAQEIENENTAQIVLQIAKHLNVNVDGNDIKSTSRKATMNENAGFPRSIVVEFHNKTLRDEILKNKKTKRITTKNLDENTNNERPIYISEQLTARKQYIFKIARDMKRSQQIKFAWAKNGELFIRKAEDSRIIKIKHIEQLKHYQNALVTNE